MVRRTVDAASSLPITTTGRVASASVSVLIAPQAVSTESPASSMSSTTRSGRTVAIASSSAWIDGSVRTMAAVPSMAAIRRSVRLVSRVALRIRNMRHLSDEAVVGHRTVQRFRPGDDITEARVVARSRLAGQRRYGLRVHWMNEPGRGDHDQLLPFARVPGRLEEVTQDRNVAEPRHLVLVEGIVAVD